MYLELEQLWIASMGNGSTKYLSQHKSNARGENENETNCDTIRKDDQCKSLTTV